MSAMPEPPPGYEISQDPTRGAIVWLPSDQSTWQTDPYLYVGQAIDGTGWALAVSPEHGFYGTFDSRYYWLTPIAGYGSAMDEWHVKNGNGEWGDAGDGESPDWALVLEGYEEDDLPGAGPFIAERRRLTARVVRTFHVVDVTKFSDEDDSQIVVHTETVEGF